MLNPQKAESLGIGPEAFTEHTISEADFTCDAPETEAMPDWWPTATCTRLTTTKPSIVTKSFALDENGVLTKSTVASVTNGRVETVKFADLGGLAVILGKLTPAQCLIYGIAPADSLELVTDDAWVRDGKPAHQVARTKEAFHWPDDPGVMMLDYDPPGDGDALTRDQLIATVRGACPGLSDVEMLWWPSASSCIVNTTTGATLRGIRGQRLYLMVTDARDIPRAGKALCERLWAAGHGCFAISGAGSLLERALFDTSVWQSNRIDFAAGAECLPPLQQQRGDPVLIPGALGRVDTMQAIPEPDAGMLTLAEERKADARRLRQSKAEQVKAAWSAERVKVMAPRIAQDEGIPIEQATQRAQRTVDRATGERMELLEDWPLVVQFNGMEVTVTVGEVLKDPARWDGCITKDPLETDYDGGRRVGKLYLIGGRPTLHSQAHGGQTFSLVEEHDINGKFCDIRQAQREAARVIGEGEAFIPLPELLTVADMVQRFVFLADGSRVFDTLHPAHGLALPDFRNASALSVTEMPTGDHWRGGVPKTKTVANATLWLSDAGRKSAIGSTFKAGAGLFVNDPNGRHCVNLWGGFKRPTVNGTGDAALFVAHVEWLFKDRAREFIDWLAHIEQLPGVLPHTAWLHISSNTGTGRNWIASVLARVFAGHAATSVDLVALLESGFNERLSRKVLAVVDEIREGGPEQWRHSETLKQMITAETRCINTKYGRQSMEHNACRFLLFSNHRAAIPIDDNDRRIEVVISDEPPHPPWYYSTLYAAIADPEFIAAVAGLLATRDLSKFNPGRHAARTAAKTQVVTASASDEVSALRQFTETYPLELATATRLAVEGGCESFGRKSTAFARLVGDAGWVKLGRRRIGGKDRREVLYAKCSVASTWSAEGVSGFDDQLPTLDGGQQEISGLTTPFRAQGA